MKDQIRIQRRNDKPEEPNLEQQLLVCQHKKQFVDKLLLVQILFHWLHQIL